MDIQDIQKIIKELTNKLTHMPIYELIASKMLVDIIIKSEKIMTFYNRNYYMVQTPYNNIYIHVEPFFVGYEAVLLKDKQVVITIDKDGNGKILNYENNQMAEHSTT